MEEQEEGEQQQQHVYVKAASRFFRVEPPRGGGPLAPRRRLHYLESCFLCKKAIACDRDVFMYRGDAAFCSEDCRLDQMDMDDALHAVARRRHRLLLLLLSSSQQPAALVGEAPSGGPPTMMRRRPTIANLAARNPPVPAT